MSTRPEDNSSALPVDTSAPIAPGSAERIARYSKRAGYIVLLILFVCLMLALGLAIPVGYYWTKYKVSLVQFGHPIRHLMNVTQTYTVRSLIRHSKKS